MDLVSRMSQELFSPFPKRRPILLGLLICLLFMLYFIWPMFQNLSYMQNDMDWYGFGSMYESFRIAVLEYGQFPLRTPYLEGGYPIIGFPYDISLSPFSLIILLFGSTPGMKLIMALAFLIGAAGMFYLLKRALALNLAASIFGTSAFSLCAWLPMQVDNGNIPLVMAPYLGIWAVAFYIRALEKPWFAVAGALAMVQVIALTVQSAIPLTLLLGLICILYMFTGLKPRAVFSFSLRPVWILALMAVLTTLFAAPKLVAIADFENRLVGHVHIAGEDQYENIEKAMVDHYGVYPPNHLLRIITQRNKNLPKEQVDIYSLYQGPVVLVLAALALLFAFRFSVRWGVVLLFFFCFNIGPFCPVNLYEILWHLFWPTKYIWKIVKYFSFYIAIPIAVMSAMFFEFFTNKRSFYIPALILFLCAFSFSVFDAVSGNRHLIAGLYTKPMPTKDQLKAEPFGQLWVTGIPEHRYNDLDSIILTERHFSQYVYLYMMKNIGTINWPTNQIMYRGGVVPKFFAPSSEFLDFEALPISKLQINPEYRGEATFAPTSRNTVWIKKFSPNVMVFEVEIVDETPLIINQNYHDHFRTSVGKIFEAQGAIGLRLPMGKHTVILRFVPWPFFLGLGISLLALSITGALFIRSRRKKKAKQ